MRTKSNLFAAALGTFFAVGAMPNVERGAFDPVIRVACLPGRCGMATPPKSLGPTISRPDDRQWNMRFREILDPNGIHGGIHGCPHEFCPNDVNQGYVVPQPWSDHRPDPALIGD
jgi:hypothetical protein